MIKSPAKNCDNNSSCDEDEEEEEKHLTSSLTTSNSKKTGDGRGHCSRPRKKADKELDNLTNEALTKTVSSVAYDRPPDGGWGWCVVFASFMINFICDGVSFSSGIFFVKLVETLKETKSKTAWVSSVFLAIPLIAGPVASALTDHFGCRKMAIIGSILTATGFLLSSLVTSEQDQNGIEYLLVTFSISGLGMAFCYVTSIVSVAYYFEKRRSLATGLAVCGSGFGTMLLPYFFSYLLRVITYQQTFVVVAFIFLTIVGFGFLIRDLDIDALIMSRDVSSSSSEGDEEDEESDNEKENDSDGDTSDMESNSAFQSEGLSLPNSPTSFSRLKQTSQRSLNNHKMVNEPTTSRSSGRKRHISENIEQSDKMARTSTSLINIPTYLQNGQLSQIPSTGADIETGEHQACETQFTEMFRHGGHLNNLIKCYPHLLDFFLPGLDKCSLPQNEQTNGKSTAMALSTHEPEDVAPISLATGKGEEDRRVVEFDLPDDDLLDSSDNLHYRRDSINANSISSPNIGVVMNSNTNEKMNNEQHISNVVEGKELLRKSTGQLYNFCSGTGRGRHLNGLTTHRQLSELSGGNTLHKLRLQRGSLTYRGAMLVIGSKYRLKASSAPDIYRTSMATINGEDKVRYEFIFSIFIIF